MQSTTLGNEHTDRVKEEKDNESKQSNVQMNA